MWSWSHLRTRVLLVPVVPAVALGVIVGFDLHRSIGVVIAAVVAVFVAFALALLVAHSITRPLRDLAAIAADSRALREAEGSAPPDDDMLPPRYTDSASPLAELAVAIANGRRHATQVVTEQRAERRSVTDLVANLALRNERLLGAALDALGEIGRRDHDPSIAAAIARVHRIVARVDRSTASALVLIGEGGRVAPNSASITDVVWAAALAIESSERVDADSLPPATLHADVVGDVSHLVAELLDNAVAASAPPGRVTVLGAADADGGYELTVVDAGTGMGADDLEMANERVRRRELLHRVPTRNIGLDVVGRLARRHNIVVRLGQSAEGGVVVRVLLPPSLLTAPVAVAPEADVDVVEPQAPPTRELEVAAPVEPPAPDAPETAAPEPTWVHSAGDEPPVPVEEPATAETWYVEAHTETAVDVAPPEAVPIAAPAVPEIDLTAFEQPTAPTVPVVPVQSTDDMLPHRESPSTGRKWAAAIARARN